MTPRPGLRLGNFLYLWMRAHQRTAGAQPTLALEARAMGAVAQRVPRIRRLTIARDSVRFRDRREWDAAWLYQRFGVDFTADDISAFVRATRSRPMSFPTTQGRS